MVRVRNPEETRQKLLDAALEEIHLNGYTAASMDQIVERSGVTKGALYHHFGSKKALAQDVIDSSVRSMVVESFLEPVRAADNPIDGIIACIEAKCSELTADMVSCGCPLNNLAQELSSTDDDFQAQIGELYSEWRTGLADALRTGQAKNQVRADVDPDAVATFIVAVCAGSAGFAKSARSVAVATASATILGDYLGTLRA